MKQSPVRILLILLFVFIGGFGVAYAAAGMFTALPAPAIGGTCGPSTGSETAAEALTEPGSIGAGPQPAKTNVSGHHQWATFVQQCQSLADRRGLASLAILVVSLAVAGIGLFWVLRKPKHSDAGSGAEPVDVNGTPNYTPLGLHDPALVGAGATAGGSPAPVATWSEQPPRYGAPPAYPAPDPGAPVGGGYPQPPQAYPQPGYPQQAYPQQAYPQPGYPQQAYPQQAYPQQAYPQQPDTYPQQVQPQQSPPIEAPGATPLPPAPEHPGAPDDSGHDGTPA
jgi:hypothetical protein